MTGGSSKEAAIHRIAAFLSLATREVGGRRGGCAFAFVASTAPPGGKPDARRPASFARRLPACLLHVKKLSKPVSCASRRQPRQVENEIERRILRGINNNREGIRI
jgi:hypothetical protein